MASHKRKRPRNRPAGCKMRKDWKVNGVRTESTRGEKYSDHVRRTVATKAAKEALLSLTNPSSIH